MIYFFLEQSRGGVDWTLKDMVGRGKNKNNLNLFGVYYV